MNAVEQVFQSIGDFVSSYIMPDIVKIVALLGVGLFLTLRLGFVQIRRLKHGIEVTSGKYDDPNEPGDVSHFQALTTALSATVGVGNIAGVAIAIHFGGPGALFWMWMTAFFGMAVKYSEVTMALKYRDVATGDGDLKAWEGSVSGGPMYYIEKGLGSKWKPMAIFFALMLMVSSFLTGNAIQANTVSDLFESKFGISPYLIGIITSGLVAAIIFGGIKRIGKVTSILAPLMALVYIFGALIIIFINASEILPAFGTIFAEAFNPTSGVAGTGAGAIMLTIQNGVARGLFSNEAGQGSAPIAHAAAKTDEPVSEGVVALLEPFIDTIVICTITGLVLITTGTWNTKHPTDLDLGSGDISFIRMDDSGNYISTDALQSLEIRDGVPVYSGDNPVKFAWHNVSVDAFFTDEAQKQAFSGVIDFTEGTARSTDGQIYKTLHGDASYTGAPLTMKAFSKHLGDIGEYIVILCVALFAVSTAISWSYYGDRCAMYVFGKKAIIPYKLVYVFFHFLGAVLSLNVIWNFGDVALGIVIIPNLIALVLLSGNVAKSTDSYFERKPWKKFEKK